MRRFLRSAGLSPPPPEPDAAGGGANQGKEYLRLVLLAGAIGVPAALESAGKTMTYTSAQRQVESVKRAGQPATLGVVAAGVTA